ncbi:MAG: ABC transporter ATP-binding protein [Spirochaetaceae bacterium]|nr:ABC transporter ATP-binding protein [Spirochaetaceae bacterium]
MNIIKKLTFGLEKKYKLYTFLSPLAMLGEVAMEVLIPIIMANIIDVGIANRNIAYVTKTGLLMIAAACFSLLCGVAAGRFSAVAATGFSHNLRRRLFAKVQDFAFSNMDKFGTASMITRLTTDVTNTQNTYQMLIRICIRSPVMLVSATIMACLINAKLALVFFLAIPILAIALVIITTKAFPRFKEMLKKYDSLNNKIQENLAGIRVVKSFVRESHETDEFKKTADQLRSAQVKAEKIIIFNMPIMQIMMYACIIAILWSGGSMVIGGTMQTGELISFVTYVNQILMSLMMISMIFVMLVLSKASISRISEIIDETPHIMDCAASLNQIKDGSVEFKNVGFSYNPGISPQVLHNINLKIPSGATVGIIGGTGSSKTTLVQLIPRLYDATEGQVLVGGTDVKQLALEPLRNNVAMVLQKNVLFSGTIRDNLLWGDKNATEQEITEACKAADADTFVRSFPEGYQTMLGQGGVNLSGGQKQRLCIARALLKKPKILILDDSTSAVDTATDARIRNALKNTLPETTKIIIAQRITSVQEADMILVMDNGNLVATGNHSQLLETCNIYREVYDSQQKSKIEEDKNATNG